METADVITDGDYSHYVEHPRYGRGPRFNGVKPKPIMLGYRLSNYNGDLIGGTAIEADLSRQSPSPVPVTYYFDLDKKCRQCGRSFIFFAEEQKHWYEELGFNLDADCIHCPLCRKKFQFIALKKKRYEALFHLPKHTPNEALEMAECSLTLIEEGIFHFQQIERVQAVLKKIPDELQPNPEFRNLLSRVKKLGHNRLRFPIK